LRLRDKLDVSLYYMDVMTKNDNWWWI